ncbi:MAG: prepilin-type N-terminal cleavage/methylation domain-containing protein [Candidatus Riflebacteria bacterium]|nr:prepilin-type N-terminal cleavage/methylation domain-containing protein [Candidatus Riflebacteria bacterium]
MKRRGFTLMEVVISSAIMLSLFTSVIWIFTSSGKSINSGSWRVNQQKNVQTFIEEWAKDLEEASPYISTLGSQGIMLPDPANPTTPIAVNSKIYSTTVPKKAKLLTVCGSDWVCLMSFCITQPFVEKSATMGITLDTPGEWTGISVWGNGHQIQYIRTDDPSYFSATPKNLPSGITPQYPSSTLGGVSSTGKFHPSGKRIKAFIPSQSFEEISITATGTPINLLEIRTKCVRYENALPAVPEQSFEQVINAKLATGSSIQTF